MSPGPTAAGGSGEAGARQGATRQAMRDARLGFPDEPKRFERRFADLDMVERGEELRLDDQEPRAAIARDMLRVADRVSLR